MTGEDALSWRGYLAALARRRRDFMAFGATASDHGHPTAFTANLPPAEAEVLFARVASGRAAPDAAELFRGQMLTEMARMSLEASLSSEERRAGKESVSTCRYRWSPSD